VPQTFYSFAFAEGGSMINASDRRQPLGIMEIKQLLRVRYDLPLNVRDVMAAIRLVDDCVSKRGGAQTLSNLFRAQRALISKSSATIYQAAIAIFYDDDLYYKTEEY
jgi:hypothetical protein